MPHTKLISVAMLAVIAAAPAAADPRDGDGRRGSAYDQGERADKTRAHKTWHRGKSAQHRKHKRWRYVHERRYRYAYPWGAWGPFAFPPGL